MRNSLYDFIEEQTELEDGTWRFHKIIAHRTTGSHGRKKHEVLIDWESGECIYELISAIYKGDKYLLAEYARDHNLLDEWESPRLNIGNAYLEAYTKEKVYIIAGPKFVGLERGHIFVIVRALYGLKDFGLRWHERFSNVLRDMGFASCPAEPDIWMKDRSDHHEYIVVYCDDLTTLQMKSKLPAPLHHRLGIP